MRSLLLAASVLALAGCGAKDGGAQGPPPGAPGDPPPSVTVAHPLSKPIVDWDDYTGRFEAVDSVDVRPRVSGYLQSLNFRDGQFVRKGQLLMTIDPRPFQAVYDQAKADEGRYVAAAQVAATGFARVKQLLDLKAASQEEYDNAQATLRQAQAQVGSAKANTKAKALDVEFTSVVAPASGRASDRKVSIGNFVSSGQTVLTTIVSLNPIHFVFTGSEAVYLKYQRANRAGTRPSSRVAANPVDIRLADETAYRWHGRMDFVDNTIDRGSGTIRGRAVIGNPDGLLTPGMFGHMRLLGSGAYQGLLVPEDAVVTDQTRKTVLVVGADGKVAQRVLELGPIVDGLRVVRSGLAATDNVIIAGVQRAHAGAPVKTVQGRIVPPDPGSAPSMPSFTEPPATSATSASSVSAAR